MTDTEQLLSDSIDKISELSIENHRLKAQIEKMRSALIEVTCQSVNTTSEIYKKNTEQVAVLTEENRVLKAHLRR